MENLIFVLPELSHRNFCNTFGGIYSTKEEPAKFWILFLHNSELISMICFFWRVSIFCFCFNKLLTVLPSQSSIHLLHLRQCIGEAACLKLIFRNGKRLSLQSTSAHCRMGLDPAVFLSLCSTQGGHSSRNRKQDTFPLTPALHIPHL